jgi:hypothetical protein
VVADDPDVGEAPEIELLCPEHGHLGRIFGRTGEQLGIVTESVALALKMSSSSAPHQRRLWGCADGNGGSAGRCG